MEGLILGPRRELVEDKRAVGLVGLVHVTLRLGLALLVELGVEFLDAVGGGPLGDGGVRVRHGVVDVARGGVREGSAKREHPLEEERGLLLGHGREVAVAAHLEDGRGRARELEGEVGGAEKPRARV